MNANTIKTLVEGAVKLSPLFFASGCASVGLYQESQVRDIGEDYRQRGYDEAMSQVIRMSEHESQDAAAEKQIREEYHTIWVEPSIVNGVQIEGHYLPIKVIVED
ncbi:MAG: hypothetical protein ACPGN3_15955 [Opitutales bacterium]